LYRLEQPRDRLLVTRTERAQSELAMLSKLNVRKQRTQTGDPVARLPPMRFLPLQRFPAKGQRHIVAGIASPDRLAPSGFLNLLTPSSALKPASLISCWIRSWGFPFRALLYPRSRTASQRSIPSCRCAHHIQSTRLQSSLSQARRLRQFRLASPFTVTACTPVRRTLDFKGLLHASIWYHCRRFRPTSSP